MKKKELKNDELIELLTLVLNLIGGKSITGEFCEYELRSELAYAYSDKEEYKMAAKTLADMHIE